VTEHKLLTATAERLSGLAMLLKAERARRGLSQRAAAAQMGLAYPGICRFERGGLPDVPNFLAILAWLDVPLAALLGEEQARTFDAYQRGWRDCEAVVRAALEDRGGEGS